MNDIGCSGISIDTEDDDYESDARYGGDSYPDDQRQYCFDFRPEGDRRGDLRPGTSGEYAGRESSEALQHGRPLETGNGLTEI